MANHDFARFSRKVVQYFWDPLPRNEDPAPIWCLGRSYESRYHGADEQARSPVAASASTPDPRISPADSAVESRGNPARSAVDEEKEEGNSRTDDLAKSQADLTRAEEEALGWPPEFLDDLESRIWMTYRSNFAAIPKSPDPNASTGISFSTRLRNLGNQSGFTSDTGYGCMIRSGQSLLANSLSLLRLGRDWRVGSEEQTHAELLGLFADAPEAPFSIHKFVEHGAQACGKHPGEWFGPSATARCIQELTNKYAAAGLRVYARPDDGDVYADTLLHTASQLDANNDFQPTLIVLGVRLGIDRITPVYHAALQATLEMPQCVGIAGGRPSSSHYFVGHQGAAFFYLDPHSTRPALPAAPAPVDVATCHTRRVRRLALAEMDPSMLLGFLVRSRAEFAIWRAALEALPGKPIVHVHDAEPSYASGGGVERAGAVDEVETWDEATGGEDDGDGEDEEGGN